jgi:hypothetical protein
MHRYLSKLGSLRLELIAPAHYRSANSTFLHGDTDPWRYERRLDELQRFRGGVYAQESFLRPQDLDWAGRHYSPLDRKRWHVLVVDPLGAIKACVSLHFYSTMPDVEDLTVFDCLRRSTGLELPKYVGAIRQWMGARSSEGLVFGEVGGWAVGREVRNGAATISTIQAAWSLPRLLGNKESLCIATVGKGLRAEKILLRMGGFQISDGHRALPHFFDPGYNSQIEVLGFDSRQTPATMNGFDELAHRLQTARLIAPQIPVRRRAHPVTLGAAAVY